MTIESRLAEIRARVDAAIDLEPGSISHALISTTHAPALLAAVEAVRELADRLEWEADPANHLGSDLDYCRIATAQRIRTALTAALEVEG